MSAAQAGPRGRQVLLRTPATSVLWLKNAIHASSRQLTAAQVGVVPVADVLSGRRLLATGVQRLVDLQRLDTMDKIRDDAVTFNAIWLRFALASASAEIPAILAAMQGRKIAALVLDELEHDKALGVADDDLRGRFLSLRVQLRRLALGLQVIEGGREAAFDPGARSSVLAANPEVSLERLAEYSALLAEFHQVRLELVRSDPDLNALSAPMDIDAAKLQQRLAPYEAIALLVQSDAAWPSSGSSEKEPVARVRAYAQLLRRNSHELIVLPVLSALPLRVRHGAVTRKAGPGFRYSRCGVVACP